uniref:Uncharacterized protein n=1 Tax=Corethrella appendiculata TaxID=1370023 RepID=U5EQ43_9DIPT
MLRKILLKKDIVNSLIAIRKFSKPGGAKVITNQPEKPLSGDVPGLSSAVILKKSEPLGPGASISGEYKVPEYFSYNQTSYFEAEVEMEKFRLPQPSSIQQ